MAALIKICGINSAVAADAAIRGAADYAGLVFHRASPRRLEAGPARALADRMRGRLKLVALVADAGDDEIAQAVHAVRPDFLQLHGSETPDRVAAIRGHFSIGIIKALAVSVPSDVARARDYENLADMFLFDALQPAGADRPGGHGAAFDWRLLLGQTFSRPWLLAGGLTPENVARAIAASGAPGVDVSSGVETSRGEKDPSLIGAFIANARAARFAEART